MNKVIVGLVCLGLASSIFALNPKEENTRSVYIVNTSQKALKITYSICKMTYYTTDCNPPVTATLTSVTDKAKGNVLPLSLEYDNQAFDHYVNVESAQSDDETLTKFENYKGNGKACGTDSGDYSSKNNKVMLLLSDYNIPNNIMCQKVRAKPEN